MYLLGGVVSVFFLWTFVAGFMFTKEELAMIANHMLCRKRTEKVDKRSDKQMHVHLHAGHEFVLPLPNTTFDRSKDFSFVDPPRNAGKTFTSFTVQPLQRRPVGHRRASSFSGIRDTNYLKQATTRKIIDSIKVTGSTSINLSDGRNEVAYFLLCTTKTNSFITIQTKRSLRRLHKVMQKTYLLEYPLVLHKHKHDALNVYFQNMLSHPQTRCAPELVQSLLVNRYTHGGKIRVVS